MKTLLEQLPVLLGVGLGALATIVTTALNDRRQWRRAQSVRWDERRFVAYTEYARAIKDVYKIAARLAAGHDPADLLRLEEAREQRTKVWESVLLLGDAPTVTAARDWRLAVRETERIAVDGPHDDMEWAAAVHAVNEARDAFYRSARESLAVHGDTVAQAAWLSTELPSR